MNFLLDHCRITSSQQDLLDLTDEELLEKYEYSETSLRYCLMVVMVATSGKRSDACCNLTIKELACAKKANGLFTCLVRKHKVCNYFNEGKYF